MMEENKDQLSHLFDKVRNKPSQISFDDVKEKFLKANSNTEVNSFKEKLKQFIIKHSIIMMSILSALLFTTAIFTVNFNQSEPIKEKVSKKTIIKTDSIRVIKEQKRIIKNYYESVDYNIEDESIVEIPSTVQIDKKIEKETLRVTTELQAIEEPYHFPKLTEKEIKANNKQKAKMLKSLAKFNKKKYAYIPAGSKKIKGEIVSIQSFFMQKTEVTNLEYRTFLFDLLIQDRKDAFLIAAPSQEMWTEEYPDSFNEPMQEKYFSHPAYNNYPVVAISRAGAELYCDWLTSETVKAYPKKVEFLNDVRIPTAYEWMYAAYGSHDTLEFPFGTQGVRVTGDSCYLANYNPGDDEFAVDGAMYTCGVNSYIPNDYGLYCMSGNAAEMVYYYFDNQTPGTKGGSWTSNLEGLKIEAEDPYYDQTKPSVNIGFRVVITHQGRAITEK